MAVPAVDSALIRSRIGCRDREKIPDQRAGGGVVCPHESADAVLGARRADDHLIVDDEGRHRFRVTFGWICYRGHPLFLASLLIEGNELGVERRHIHVTAGYCDTAVVGSAARRADRGVLVLVAPQRL